MKNITIMGVVNANEDSFFEGSRFEADAAIVYIKKIINDGAGIIDLGGVSSRPGSVGVSEELELERIKPIIDAISTERLYEMAQFSLDSYSPLCVEYALKRGFSIINDISSLENDAVAALVAQYDASVVLMHKQGDTRSMQENPHYENVVLEVDAFFKERIAKAKRFGINKIILDVGIGFGKTLEHNLLLLKHHAHFLHFGYPLLLAASRKSMINEIHPSSIQDRLPGTLAIHLWGVQEGVSILRVHDVDVHKQAIAVQQSILGA